MRYALINLETKKVVNIIEWDGKSNWKPPVGHVVLRSDEANPQDEYIESTKTFLRNDANK